MANVTRRLFLQGAGALVWATAGVGSYAFAFEPALRLNITSYHLCPPPMRLRFQAQGLPGEGLERLCGVRGALRERL